jgi:hypothetical protein
MSHNTIIQMEIKKHMYSQTCVNDHLLTTTTCQQQRALTPSPGKKNTLKLSTNLCLTTTFLTMTFYLGVPRVCVVLSFDCISFISSTAGVPNLWYAYH